MVAVRNSGTRKELRKNLRRPFHYNAKILVDKSTPPIPCSISNVSEKGARLALEDAGELPDSFVLLLTANGGARRHCRIIWRKDTIVGVKFPQAG